MSAPNVHMHTLPKVFHDASPADGHLSGNVKELLRHVVKILVQSLLKHWGRKLVILGDHATLKMVEQKDLKHLEKNWGVGEGLL